MSENSNYSFEKKNNELELRIQLCKEFGIIGRFLELFGDRKKLVLLAESFSQATGIFLSRLFYPRPGLVTYTEILGASKIKS